MKEPIENQASFILKFVDELLDDYDFQIRMAIIDCTKKFKKKLRAASKDMLKELK